MPILVEIFLILQGQFEPLPPGNLVSEDLPGSPLGPPSQTILYRLEQ